MRTRNYIMALSLAFAGASAFAQIKTSVGTITDWRGTVPFHKTLIPRERGPRGMWPQPAKLSQPDGNCRQHRAAQPVVTVVTVYAPVYDSTAAIYAYEESKAYYQPGFDWGVGLKGNNIDWADFIPYLQKYVVSASSVAQDAFRQGFIMGFGSSAEAAYEHAMRQAGRPG